MNTRDYIKQLSYGVLKNTIFGSVDQTQADSVLPLLALIQEGLDRLYTRFLLRERHLILEMQEGVTFYHLDKKYALQSHDPILVPYPYIIDLPNDKFEDDVIKVLQVLDSLGNIRPLNDPDKRESLYTVQYNVIQNSYPRNLEALYVTYQATHVPIFTVPNCNNDFTIGQEILLSPALVPALNNYVAHAVYSSVNTQEAQAKSVMHLSIYEQICQEVDKMDSVSNSMSCSNTRFIRNGWV